MDEVLIDRLVEEGKTLAAGTGSARESQLLAEAVLALKAVGLSVDAIAELLSSSPSLVQFALTTAIARRPASARREERFPYELHVLLAAKLYEQPEKLLIIARKNLRRMRETPRASIAEGWLDRWEGILEFPAAELEQEMLMDTQEGRDMRQMSPFAGALDQSERMVALKKAQFLAAS